MDPYVIGKVKAASSLQKIVHTDLYICTYNDSIYYDIISPINYRNNKPSALLLFRIDPFSYLYPLVKSWPTINQTGETVLLRVHKNGSLLYLNQLRFRKNTALKFSIPLSKLDAPGVQAARGRYGLFDGIDYSGKEVLSDIGEFLQRIG